MPPRAGSWTANEAVTKVVISVSLQPAKGVQSGPWILTTLFVREEARWLLGYK